MFAYEEIEFYAHAWKIASTREETQFKCEIIFLMDAIKQNIPYDLNDLIKLTDAMVEKATSNGKKKAREAFEEQVAQSLRNGAGAAHKMAAIDSELPPLRLAIRQKNEQGQIGYITEPNEVAKIHSQPWAAEWKAYSPDFEKTFAPFFKQLRLDSLAEAREFASSIDAAAPKVRNALKTLAVQRQRAAHACTYVGWLAFQTLLSSNWGACSSSRWLRLKSHCKNCSTYW